MQASDYRNVLRAYFIEQAYYPPASPRVQIEAILRDAGLESIIHVASVPEEPIFSLSAHYDTPDTPLDQMAQGMGMEWLIDDDGGLHFVTRPAELLWTIEDLQAKKAAGRLKYRAGQPLVHVVGVAIDDPHWWGTGFYGPSVPRHRYAVQLQDEPLYLAKTFMVEDYEIEPA